MARDVSTLLLHARQLPIVGRTAYFALKLLGAEVPLSVKVGKGCVLLHGGFGIVVHSSAVLGKRVRLYPGVTLGRADIWRPGEASRFEGIVVEDDVIVCSGAKVLCKEGVLRLGRGTIVGANAVLLESTGCGEIWAGVPARRIGVRPSNGHFS